MSTQRIYGVVPGVVQALDDPAGEGRVQVAFPWMGGNNTSYWAPIATMMAGKGRGAWFMPEVDDEVLVAFDQGDVNHPYIIGFLWNGRDQPPSPQEATTQGEALRVRLLRSVNGHEIALYDQQPSAGDQGHIRVQDAHGNVIELANARISIRGVGIITIDAPTVIINGRLVAPAPRPI